MKGGGVQIDGNGLRLEQVEAVARGGVRVRLAARALPRLRAARTVVERAAGGEAAAYGINTGLGRLSDIRIAPARLVELQRNLLRSHACGVGPALPREVVRAMLLLRANSLAKGYSGVRPRVIDALCDLLNHDVCPWVPEQGSVGASGDLAPLAHLALVLVGEGRAHTAKGGVETGAAALRRAGLRPLELAAKEGLSLLNGTQAMLAIGVLELLAAERLLESAEVTGALSLDALRGTPVAFDPRLQEVRGQIGQAETARRLTRLLAGSEIRRSHRDCPRVQDAYSLRCMPQVHGAARDALAYARRIFAIEANAAVDNPLVFAGPAGRLGRGEVLSGGNFHGQPLSFALDFMAIALTALAGIAERRIERLVNPALNEGLPAFLAAEPGLESGLMMAQVTAAALVAECRVFAHPASVDSIPTDGNKEDYVSMGMGAALKLRRVTANLGHVLAIELVASTYALDHLLPLRTSRRLQAVVAEVRRRIPPLRGDRDPSNDFAAARDLVTQGLAPIAG